MVSLTDGGGATEEDKEALLKSLQIPPPQLSSLSLTNNNQPLATPPRLTDVPEGDVVKLDDSPRNDSPRTPKTASGSSQMLGSSGGTVGASPSGHHDTNSVEIVASPESIKDSFSSSSGGAGVPPYPTASSSTALYPSQPSGLNVSTSSINQLGAGSRRTSNASSVPPQVYYSPRVAPLSPASQAGSPAHSRTPSMRSSNHPNMGGATRQRSMSKSSGSSSAAGQIAGGNLSRRSSAAGAFRQSFSGMRMRPPSTLIPTPGQESDTIPPQQDGSNGSSHQNTVKGSLLLVAGNKIRKGKVYIRDFAYPTSDARFDGTYPSLPSSNATPSHEMIGGDMFGGSLYGDNITLGRASSQSRSRSNSQRGEGGRRKSSFGGWAGFLNGWGGRFRSDSQSGSGLGLGNVTKVDTDLDLSGDLTPSSSCTEDKKYSLRDVSETSGTSSSGGGGGGSGGQQERVHADVWDDDFSGEGDDGEVGPEPVGRYKAAYTFDSLGGHEMSVEEGEVLDIKGRGGGEGWVIAVRTRESKGADELMEGLVPESYIEPAED